jgi:hypothetical protein
MVFGFCALVCSCSKYFAFCILTDFVCVCVLLLFCLQSVPPRLQMLARRWSSSRARRSFSVATRVRLPHCSQVHWQPSTAVLPPSVRPTHTCTSTTSLLDLATTHTHSRIRVAAYVSYK